MSDTFAVDNGSYEAYLQALVDSRFHVGPELRRLEIIAASTGAPAPGVADIGRLTAPAREASGRIRHSLPATGTTGPKAGQDGRTDGVLPRPTELKELPALRVGPDELNGVLAAQRDVVREQTDRLDRERREAQDRELSDARAKQDRADAEVRRAEDLRMLEEARRSEDSRRLDDLRRLQDLRAEEQRARDEAYRGGSASAVSPVAPAPAPAVGATAPPTTAALPASNAAAPAQPVVAMAAIRQHQPTAGSAPAAAILVARRVPVAAKPVLMVARGTFRLALGA